MTERKPRYRARACPSEHQEQANFFAEARLQFRMRDDFLEPLLFSVPNGMWAGGKNKFALMAKYKREGLHAGVSDILYLQPRGKWAYLAIEMKALDRRNDADAVSMEQDAFLQNVKAAGGSGHVCYGAEEAMKVLTHYMDLEAK